MADPLDPVDWADPVADHPENANLAGWWMAGTDPPFWGADQLRDLCNRSHGTLTNFTAGGGHWRGGPNGLGSLAFDGVNDHVNCGTIPGLSGAAAASFSASLYRGSTATTVACGGSGGPSSGGNRFSLLWFSDSNLYVAAEGGAAAYGSCALSGTGWRHVVVSYDGAGSGNAGRLQVYVDGVVKSLSFTGTIPATLGTTNPWILGMDSNNRYGGGSIGDARLRLRTKTPASALAEYHQWREGYPDLLRRAPRRYTFVPVSGGGSPISGSASITCADATLSASGTVELRGSAAITAAASTLASTGAVAVSGAASLASDCSLSSSGVVGTSGAASIACADAALGSSGTVSLSGSAAIASGDSSLAASGAVAISGAASITSGDSALSAAGAVAIAGALDATFADATLAASTSEPATADDLIALFNPAAWRRR